MSSVPRTWFHVSPTHKLHYISCVVLLPRHHLTLRLHASSRRVDVHREQCTWKVAAGEAAAEETPQPSLVFHVVENSIELVGRQILFLHLATAPQAVCLLGCCRQWSSHPLRRS